MLMLQPLVKYADFNGRARRTEFWLWALLKQMVPYAYLAVAGFIAMPPMLVTEAPDPTTVETYLKQVCIYYAPLLVIGLLLLLPSLAVQVRRLHDSNRTGWWILSPFAGMAVGICLATVWFISVFHGKTPQQEAFPGVFIAILIVYLPMILAALLLFIFNLLDGTAGPNRFGPDSKGRSGVKAL